jgi:hypothetical protein
MSLRRFFLGLLLCVAVMSPILPAVPAAQAGSDVELSSGGTVYVPIYSNIFTGPRKIAYQLAATLIVRNTDLTHTITVTAVDYYDSEGKLLRSYISEPLKIGPIGGTYYYLDETDKEGGGGANFVVRWQADRKVNKPIIEGIMVGGQSGRGISYRTVGQELTEHGK